MTLFRTLIAVGALLVSSAPAFAANSYDLVYRSENRWVHKDDMKGLNALTAAAKKGKLVAFDVYLPENVNETVYLERLVILRDILQRRLEKSEIVLRQRGTHKRSNVIEVRPAGK